VFGCVFPLLLLSPLITRREFHSNVLRFLRPNVGWLLFECVWVCWGLFLFFLFLPLLLLSSLTHHARTEFHSNVLRFLRPNVGWLFCLSVFGCVLPLLLLSPRSNRILQQRAALLAAQCGLAFLFGVCLGLFLPLLFLSALITRTEFHSNVLRPLRPNVGWVSFECLGLCGWVW